MDNSKNFKVGDKVTALGDVKKYFTLDEYTVIKVLVVNGNTWIMMDGVAKFWVSNNFEIVEDDKMKDMGNFKLIKNRMAMKYKVGDKVLIKKWDDMEKQYDSNSLRDGNIKWIPLRSAVFSNEMKIYCEKILIIKEINKNTKGKYYRMEKSSYHFTDDMIEHKIEEDKIYKIKDLLGKRTAIEVNNEEDWNWLVGECDKQDIRVLNNEKWKNGKFYNEYENKGLSLLSGFLQYSSISYYQKNGCAIISINDIKEYKEESNMFKKEDLQTGMKVVLRNGEKYSVLLDTNTGDVLCNNEGFMRLTSYRDNLTANSGNKEWDIIKILQTPHENKLQNFPSEWEVVWEGTQLPQFTEVTLQEIADLKGVPVESIRIKE